MKLRKIVSVVLLVSTLFGSVLSAEAATYGKAASTGSYTSVGSKNRGLYNYNIYKNSSNWIVYYPGRKLTFVTYHFPGDGGADLEYCVSQTVETVATKNWSANAAVTSSVSAGVEGVFEAGIEVTSELGYGEEYAFGKTFAKSAGLVKHIKDSAPKGYYSVAPGRTFYKMKSIARTTNKLGMDVFYYDMPYGDVVKYAIYSKDNANWSIHWN